MTSTGRHFQAGIDELKRELATQGATVATRLAHAVRGLASRDIHALDEVAIGDAEVNARQMAIDDKAFKLLALQQPVAIDLRIIVAAIKVNADLERIGDLAVNTSERVIELNAEPPLKPYVDLPRISARVQAMVRESLDAFVSRDTALASSVVKEDDDVDQLYRRLFAELVELMRHDSTSVPRALHLLLVARNFERIADHATNIAEDVIYYVEGRDIRHAGTKQAPSAP